MNSERAIRSLSVLRVLIGLTSYLIPRAAAKPFGLDPAANPQAPYLARLFGVRDVALAVGTLSSNGQARRSWLLAGLACDLADVVSGLAGARAGYLPKSTGVLVSGTAAGAAALGVVALGSSG